MMAAPKSRKPSPKSRKPASLLPSTVVVLGPPRPGLAATLAAEVAATVRAAGSTVVEASIGDEWSSLLHDDECGVVDLASATADEAAAAMAAARGARARSYVLVSDATVYAPYDDDDDDAGAPTETEDAAPGDPPVAAAERAVLEEEAEDPKQETPLASCVVRTPRFVTSRVGFDDEALEAPFLRYVFDRIAAGRATVPLPFEWREVGVSVARETDVAALAVAAVARPSSSSRRVLNACGEIDADLSPVRTYPLSAIVRATAVAAKFDTVRTPYFLLDTKWTADLDFPIDDLGLGGYVLDPLPAHDETLKVLDSLELFADPDDDAVRSARQGAKGASTLGKRVFPEQEKKAAELEADQRLEAAIAPFYDAYLASEAHADAKAAWAALEKAPFVGDDGLIMDGDALGGSIVYKNDEFRKPLGTPRDDNPKLPLAAARLPPLGGEEEEEEEGTPVASADEEEAPVAAP